MLRGIYTAIASIIEYGDEVIVLEPSYDSYVPAIETNGGKPVFVSLNEQFEADFEAIKKKQLQKNEGYYH